MTDRVDDLLIETLVVMHALAATFDAEGQPGPAATLRENALTMLGELDRADRP